MDLMHNLETMQHTVSPTRDATVIMWQTVPNTGTWWRWWGEILAWHCSQFASTVQGSKGTTRLSFVLKSACIVTLGLLQVTMAFQTVPDKNNDGEFSGPVQRSSLIKWQMLSCLLVSVVCCPDTSVLQIYLVYTFTQTSPPPRLPAMNPHVLPTRPSPPPAAAGPPLPKTNASFSCTLRFFPCTLPLFSAKFE